MADNVTKKMLETLRRGRVEQAKWAAEQFIDESVEERDNFLTRSKILMQEAVDDKK